MKERKKRKNGEKLKEYAKFVKKISDIRFKKTCSRECFKKLLSKKYE